MIIKKTNLNFTPYLIRHFYGYALNLGIISPIFEAIPKNALSRKEGKFKKSRSFSRTKQKGGMRKNGYEKR
jgi:hypothetical protein